jgi:prenyl protein peptidase
VFRSLLIPLHLLARESPKNIVFTTPLYFGIAHIHHLYEFRLTHAEVPVLPAVLRTIVQFTYTSFFGFFAAFVYLRTGSVYTAIVAHMFCNWMGLPRFWGRIGVKTGTPISAPSAGKRSDAADGGGASLSVARRDMSIIWTVIYYTLLVVGSYGFYLYLFPLTASTNALADFSRAKAK